MIAAGDLFKLVRQGLDVRAIQANVRKPFRFLLHGDPGLVAEMRALLLSGHEESIPLDAAACLETLVPGQTYTVGDVREIRAVLSLSRNGEIDDGTLGMLNALRAPVFIIVVNDALPAVHPVSPPVTGMPGRYIVPAIAYEPLRVRVFPHLVQACKGIEIAVGRRLPPLREAVAAKLTRDAANNALKIALASAAVDHIPVLGIVLGAVASVGDTVAITGLQLMLLLHIEAAYGRDPDIQRMWEILPVIGGGLGWRTIARELSGFIPVAGIAIKGAIAYAGTIVVGESAAFFLQNGRHMNVAQASEIYERTKNDALQFAKDFAGRFIKRN